MTRPRSSSRIVALPASAAAIALGIACSRSFMATYEMGPPSPAVRVEPTVDNRLLRREQFDDDRADASEMGAGQTVTALYEIEPAHGKVDVAAKLLYQAAAVLSPAAAEGELGTLKVRYKDPDGDASRLLTWPVRDGGLALPATSNDFRFSAAVAAFGLALRASPDRGLATAAMARELAASALGGPNGDDAHKHEFLTLASKAQAVARGSD